MGNHEDAATRREHVADDVSDRVSLARSWRPLDNDTVGLLQAADNLDLILVKGFREKEISVIRINRVHLPFATGKIGRANFIPKRLIDVADAVAWTHDESSSGAIQDKGFAVV